MPLYNFYLRNYRVLRTRTFQISSNEICSDYKKKKISIKNVIVNTYVKVY